jgi:competence protein ComGC
MTTIKKQLSKKDSIKGFTIIEVALVLAVAALIFLVVFLAVPALQRNQRNDARKRDVANVVQAIASWQSNNSGSSLTAAGYSGGRVTGVLANYIDGLSNNIAQISVVSATSTFNSTNSGSRITIYRGTTCINNNSLSTSGASERQYAVGVRIELGGGNFTDFCQSV